MFFLTCVSLFAQPMTAKMTVQVDQPGIKVAPSLYGIFFEEINHAGDGGVYPELINNRSFEFNSEKPVFWTLGARDGGKASIKLEKNEDGSEYNQTVLRVEVESEQGVVSVINEGYWGVPVKNGTKYNVVVRAKADEDFIKGTGNAEPGRIICCLDYPDGRHNIAHSPMIKLDTEWKTYTVEIETGPHGLCPQARFAVVPANKGTIWFDYVSLKPADTYKGHGLRKDLMEKLEALKPAFVRFPGGCWVEGDTMKTASRWKRTIGPEIDRWSQPNLWGYTSTNGLGYHEYLQMCEDLNADAMFVINCGMSHKDHIPMDEMDEYIQDALDAIEYANGPVDSKWGKIRAENGHPKPFSLKYLQVGNENGGPVYWERYDLFHTKIREKYPEMQIVACKWGGKITNKKPIEIYDEHYYHDPQYFIDHADRYDTYERGDDKMKIYVGEYAVTKECGHGNLDAAIGEAAYMTGMEKNSDVVILTSYAPLFVNVNDRRWNPDLICFDGTRSYGIPSYHVQQLFSVHRNDVIVPTTIDMEKRELGFTGGVGVGTWNSTAEFKSAKIEKDGKTIYETDFDEDPINVRKNRGDWSRKDDLLRQTGLRDDCRYTFGENDWQDYSFNVKAKKTSGKEGFLIYFNVYNQGRWGRVNLGGWGNTKSAFQFAADDHTNKESDFIVEENRWYDVRIELKGSNAKCFVDGKQILETTMPPRKPIGIHAVSGLNATGNELIMKIVNPSVETCPAEISLEGIAKPNAMVKQILLTSKNGLDENTLDWPDKVSPVESMFKIDGPRFVKELPAKSLTILRIGIK